MERTIQQYFQSLDTGMRIIYDLCSQARKKGFDPSKEVEVVLAKNMAERVVGLISVVAPEILRGDLAKRIKELEQIYGAQDWRVALTIAREVSEQKHCSFDTTLKAMEVGIRVGIAYITNGVVSSPLEGFTKLAVGKRRDGKDYLKAYFSGPIRSAGGTAASVSVLLVDYIGRSHGYHPYDPDEKEIKRTITELYDYHERITNLQYLPSEAEIEFMFRHIPVHITGDPSETLEVSNYKSLDRIETNQIRNGLCLVLGEGLCQKAKKVYKQLQKWGKDFELDHWNFLAEFIDLQKSVRAKEVVQQTGLKPDYNFVKDLVAGRPILTHPLRQGGFRLRYGRCRTSGFSAQAIHPATMYALDSFIAIGTQLKIERPSKGCVIASCDTIEGPVVKLSNGSVLRLEDVFTAKKYVRDIVEILYLGDLLVSYGDFFNRAHSLVPAGYCEEWWALELRKAVLQKGEHISIELQHLFDTPSDHVPFDSALHLTLEYHVPLHPRYTYYWNALSCEDVLLLHRWLGLGNISEEKIILPYREDREKRALELLGVPHTVVGKEYIVVDGDWGKALFFSLSSLREEASTPLQMTNPVLLLRDKLGTPIGARMGRPEKSKMRKLTGSPQVLFPVGEEGGKMRNFQEALKKGKVEGEFPLRRCAACNTDTIYFSCHLCGKETIQLYFCYQCNATKDHQCHPSAVPYKRMTLSLAPYAKQALSLTKVSSLPELVKGIRGTSNRNHIPEHLAKGVLRALHNIYVNKDGTTRYDMTEMPITHFRPCEIGTPVEKLRELGYAVDIYGLPLERDDQAVELFIQDVILPSSFESLDETSDNVFLRIAQFIDHLLVSLYAMEPLYRVQEKKDLIGHLVVGLAPHISAGIVGRIIGFSKTQGFLAHPFFHSIVRRDCDGDELCCMLLADVFLNFSRSFLPDHRGATQDTPLVLTSTITPQEVDDMVFDMDTCWEYPLELYELSLTMGMPWDVKVEQLKERLGKPQQFFGLGYTHETSRLDLGVSCSAYKTIPTMEEKVMGQMRIAERIRAVETDDVARLIIERHFIRDIKGNLRKFSAQEFRCINCNEKFRRPPLAGVCLRCKGKIVFTISEGSIIKYLQPCLSLVEHYSLPPYLVQTLELTRQRIEEVFGRDSEKQEGLGKWFS